MFGEEKRENSGQFAPKARIAYILYSLLGLIVLSVLAFPLIVLLPFSIPLVIWYSSEWVRRFIFTLDENSLFVRQGVLLYRYNLIPYENVQDIHVAQSFTDSLFGVWSVIVFTATVGGGAVRIPLLGKESAEQLKDTLFARMKEARNVTD